MEYKNIYIDDGSVNGAKLEFFIEGKELSENNFFGVHLDAEYSNGRKRVGRCYRSEFPLFPRCKNAEESWKIFEMKSINGCSYLEILKDLAKEVEINESEINKRISKLKENMIKYLHENFFSK